MAAPPNAPSPSNPPPGQPPAPSTPTGPQQAPPLSQDLASLANILTQIQYDLFDVSVQLAQPDNPDHPFNSRIDQQAITWIKDLINKISPQLPQHQDPILPVGSQLACEFYKAKSFTQRALTDLNLFYEQHPKSKPDNFDQIIEYLQHLNNLMFIIFRWSNLIMGEKEWFWKSKDQMPKQPPPGQQPPASAPQQPSPQAPGVSKS